MQIVRSKDIEYIPASHEDPDNPGVLKKVLLVKDQLVDGRVQMINWAQLPVGNSFQAHYHEDMQEVFIIMNGEVEMKVDAETEKLSTGDAVVVPINGVHTMKNICSEDVYYMVVGISTGKGGKTVNV